MLPHAFLLQASEQAFDQPILFGCVWRHKLLLQSVVATRGAEAPTLENEPVVAADDRCGACRPEGPEADDTRLLKRSLGLSGAPSEGELDADEFTDHGSR